MGIELVVLDFDGTLTKIDEEAVPAVDSWKRAIGKELHLSETEINRLWFQAQTEIEANPSKYGWKMGNRIVAPAYADPLIMARTISEFLFDDAKVYTDRQEREDILQNKFFQESYNKLLTIFKDDTIEFLTKLKHKFRTYIVTNSK